MRSTTATSSSARRALVVTLRDEDADELRRRAGDADDLDPALAARLPHAGIWRDSSRSRPTCAHAAPCSTDAS